MHANGTRLAVPIAMGSADPTALETRVRRKLAITAYPRTEWMVPRKQLELDWSRIAAD